MDIALMNVRILFQKNAVQTDKIGNHINTWEDYYSCHATVSGEGGTEKTAAGLVVDDSDISFLSDIVDWYRRSTAPDIVLFLMMLSTIFSPLTI